MSKATLVCAWLLSACATAGSGDNGGEPQDAALQADGPAATHSDAGVHDAPVSQDAQVDQLPADAGSGSGLFCTVNSDCTVAGECCVNLGGPGFCAPGTAITPTICLPD